MNFDPQNMLIIHFGQIGDVVLSLPSLESVKKKFTGSKITLLIGKSARSIIELSNLADEIIEVDRVKLRDSKKVWSVKQILKLIGEVRRHKFDFVIDMHSLHETNLIGFLSGAKVRLFANRGNRSLDIFSNFRPKPPLLDQNLHLADYYYRNLEPLGIDGNRPAFQIFPREADLKKIKNRLREDQAAGKDLVGVNLAQEMLPGVGVWRTLLN